MPNNYRSEPAHSGPAHSGPFDLGPFAYRCLAVLAMLLAGVSLLIGSDLPTIANQLWSSAHLALAAALLAYLLSR